MVLLDDPLLRAILIGFGGTVALDVWALLVQRFTGSPAVNWAMVGRWLGHMPKGRFVLRQPGAARPVPGESIIGWSAHYVIGAGYGLAVLGVSGPGWFAAPTPWAPLLVSWALLIAPYFIMMPGMGTGVAGSKTPCPNRTRLKSLAGHTAFGVGMYGSALLLTALRPAGG